MSTGENEKALTGLTFAYFSKVQGWFDDVKVVFLRLAVDIQPKTDIFPEGNLRKNSPTLQRINS